MHLVSMLFRLVNEVLADSSPAPVNMARQSGGLPRMAMGRFLIVL